MADVEHRIHDQWALGRWNSDRTSIIGGPELGIGESIEVVPLAAYQGAVDLVERARGCVTAALNCTAHPWHGDDRARKWLMDADRLGGQ